MGTSTLLRAGATFVVVVGALVLGTATNATAQSGGSDSLSAMPGLVLEGLILEDRYRSMKSSGQLESAGRGRGFVYIEASPSDAAIQVAGKRVSSLPTTLENIETGYQRVRIQASGWSSIEGYILVKPNFVSRLRVVLPPKEGALTILSDPPGARVLIDGRAVGNAPLTIEKLDGGQHEVLLTADGGLTWKQNVMISGGVKIVRAQLARGAGPTAAVASAAPVVPAAQPMRPAAPATQPIAPPTRPAAAAVVMPTQPMPVPRPTTPAARPAQNSEVDLRGLSPDLRAVAWQKLQGKAVEVELSSGQRAEVEVREVRGDNVVLVDTSGKPRLVPMAHISKVRE